MPTYEITAPDGHRYRVTAPEGATQDQVMTYAQANYRPKQTPRNVEKKPSNPTSGMNIAEKVASGMGKAYMDTYRGVKQLGTELGKYAVDSNSFLLGKNLHGNLSNALGDILNRQQSEIDESKLTDQALMNTGAGVAGNIAGYASTLLVPGAAARGTATGRALMPATVAGNALQGAALGGLQPVATGESRAANMAVGGAAGAAAAGISSALTKSASSAKRAISDEARSAHALAKEYGVNLTAPQLSDSVMLKRLQHMTRNLPMTGAQNRYIGQLKDLTMAASKTIGENTDALTPDVFARAKLRNSARYDALQSNNSMLFDTRLAKDLASIKNDASKYADEKVQGTLSRLSGRIFDQIDHVSGTLPGETYQSVMSNITQITKNGGESAHYAGKLKGALQKAMTRSLSPSDQAEWALANRTHGNLRTLRDIVPKADSTNGIISPALLMGRVASSNAGKEALATGAQGNALADLARIGQRLKSPPTSGTAENFLAGGVFNPANWPGLAAGIAIGSPVSKALDSQSLVNYLMRENPGMKREVAAKILARISSPSAQSAIGAN